MKVITVLFLALLLLPSVAIAGPFQDGKAAYEVAGKHLTHEQIEAVQKRVEEWKPVAAPAATPAPAKP